MIIAPLNANLVSPDLETSAPSFKDALAAQKSMVGGAPQIGALEPYVKTFEANYPAFNATFDKAQLFALCKYYTRDNVPKYRYALTYYIDFVHDYKTPRAAMDHWFTNADFKKEWNGLSVAERRSYVNDAYHEILNNQIADTYKKNFEEMLDNLSRLSGPTPEQAAGIYLKYKNFLNEFYHIAEYYQPTYMEKYTTFESIVIAYSEAHNKTRNYQTRQLLSDSTTNGKQTILASGGIWSIADGPKVGIKLDESVKFFTGGQTTYSRARAVAKILQSDGWMSPKIGGLYGTIDVENAYELLGISNRQIEMYSKSAVIGHVGASSALTHSDGSGIWASFLKIEAADAVHSKGLEVLLCALM
jgi:hypothetical protein